MPTMNESHERASQEDAIASLNFSCSSLCEGRCDAEQTELSSTEPANNLIALVAGEFADDVARIWAGARVAHYLTASDARRHLWHCWLASERANLERKFRADPAATFRRLMTAKGRNLIEAAYGICPAGLIRALAKCGPQARQRTFYRALVEALTRDDLGAKFIRHSNSLSDDVVLNVAALPTHLQSKPLFEALRTGAICFEDLAHFAWAVAAIERQSVEGSAAMILRATKPLDALKEAIQSLPFPAPPWPGDDLLRPVGSRTQLNCIARLLDNCLATPRYVTEAVSDALRGRCFFYEWLGREPGLLRFHNVSPLGWILEDGRGVKNAGLSSGTWIEIERSLDAWCDLAPVWVTSGGDLLESSFLHNQLSLSAELPAGAYRPSRRRMQ
jgi:hypothetical protein